MDDSMITIAQQEDIEALNKKVEELKREIDSLKLEIMDIKTSQSRFGKITYPPYVPTWHSPVWNPYTVYCGTAQSLNEGQP